MKSVNNRLVLIALYAAIIFLNSCQEEDHAKTDEEVQLEKLNGTWTMTKAVNGGIERSNEFVSMKITFDGTYAPGGIYNLATDADDMPIDSPLTANETWKFNTAYVSGLINLQSDLRLIRYGFLDSTFRQLLIEYDDTGTGNWQFFFSKEKPDD
jgi:hypothetical protein